MAFGCSPIFALDPDRSIAQFTHTSWTANEMRKNRESSSKSNNGQSGIFVVVPSSWLFLRALLFINICFGS